MPFSENYENEIEIVLNILDRLHDKSYYDYIQTIINQFENYTHNMILDNIHHFRELEKKWGNYRGSIKSEMQAIQPLIKDYMHCPFCGRLTDVSIDHHLPKSTFNIYTFFLPNLVPCCTKCNNNVKHQNTNFHPYFSIKTKPIVNFNFTGNIKEFKPEYTVDKTFFLKTNNNKILDMIREEIEFTVCSINEIESASYLQLYCEIKMCEIKRLTNTTDIYVYGLYENLLQYICRM